MTVHAPPIAWPADFQEIGPEADPAILLSAEASIGSVRYLITALRMHEGMRRPDYRENVSAAAYEDKLESLLDEIETLSSSIEPELVTIDDGRYLLWMVPRAQEE